MPKPKLKTQHLHRTPSGVQVSQDQSFEKLFSELEETVAKLEAGDLALDDSLALFQRGTELAKQCAALLEHAELRVKELSPRGDEVEMDDLEEEEE